MLPKRVASALYHQTTRTACIVHRGALSEHVLWSILAHVQPMMSGHLGTLGVYFTLTPALRAAISSVWSRIRSVLAAIVMEEQQERSGTG